MLVLPRRCSSTKKGVWLMSLQTAQPTWDALQKQTASLCTATTLFPDRQQYINF